MSEEFIRREGERILKDFKVHDSKREAIIDKITSDYRRGVLPTGGKIMIALRKEGKKHLAALRTLERENNKRGY